MQVAAECFVWLVFDLNCLITYSDNVHIWIFVDYIYVAIHAWLWTISDYRYACVVIDWLYCCNAMCDHLLQSAKCKNRGHARGLTINQESFKSYYLGPNTESMLVQWKWRSVLLWPCICCNLRPQDRHRLQRVESVHFWLAPPMGQTPRQVTDALLITNVLLANYTTSDY